MNGYQLWQREQEQFAKAQGRLYARQGWHLGDLQKDARKYPEIAIASYHNQLERQQRGKVIIPSGIAKGGDRSCVR